MKKIILFIFTIGGLLLSSCSKDENNDAPVETKVYKVIANKWFDFGFIKTKLCSDLK